MSPQITNSTTTQITTASNNTNHDQPLTKPTKAAVITTSLPHTTQITITNVTASPPIRNATKAPATTTSLPHTTQITITNVTTSPPIRNVTKAPAPTTSLPRTTKITITNATTGPPMTNATTAPAPTTSLPHTTNIPITNTTVAPPTRITTTGPVLSKCQREAREAKKHIGTYIPQCKADGSYNKMQCWGSTGKCWCVKTTTGKEVPGTRIGKVLDCSKGCSDKLIVMCTIWKAKGYCTLMKEKMGFWCARTCGFCSFYRKCGVSSIHKERVNIIGGTAASPGAWSWMVTLQHNGNHVCGATLLAPGWVLTASHCVGSITDTTLREWTVKLGDHEFRVLDPSVQTRKIKRIITNPHWDHAERPIADLALLHLNSPAMLTKRVNVPCLPKKGVDPPIGKNCILTGWGSINVTGRAYHTLQQVSLPTVERSKCRNHKEDICVGKGSKSEASACRGDLGGPLVCQRIDGTWQLDGVASFMHTLCKYYTAYAPVNKYIDWIDNYINS